MKRILLSLLLLLSFQSSGFAAPDPSTNPVLGGIQKMGAKLYYLGKDLGLDGWFIVKDGQVQMLYATPDNKGALVGALFASDGSNMTTQQVQTLVRNNKEVADLVANAQKEASIAQIGNMPAAPSSSQNAIPSVSLSPGERLLHEVSSAASVVVGNGSSPEIVMVMDTHCPHCQATWKAMRDTIFRGTMHLRMVPIGTADTESEREAAVLLASSDPLNAWDKYVAGDKSQLAGTPTASAIAAVRANHTIIDNWSIHDTPYLVYRSREGKVKVVVGEPEKVSTVLTDLGV